MSDYTNERALGLQEIAFGGDVGAMEELIEYMKPHAYGEAKRLDVEKQYMDDLWHDCVVRMAQRVASGNFTEYWKAWCKQSIHNIVWGYVRAASRRKKREEGYMERLCTRINKAYPELHSCVAELEELHNEMIHRIYFRPVRQNLLEFSEEFCMNYWSVRKMHRKVLGILREMLMERGITHA